ncbi:unnamed protein product [Mytilus edulis]|uniref:Uncharacterized protein n=1 Tax=Mytilus edulis TaxID=6550 RepID=A0A8S3S8C2_MYTED|nr:unnamed protein product [Mytilus edulis]
MDLDGQMRFINSGTGARFCTGCGTEVQSPVPLKTTLCPSCNNIVVIGCKFCQSCGGKIDPALFIDRICHGTKDNGQKCNTVLTSGTKFCPSCGTLQDTSNTHNTSNTVVLPGDAPLKLDLQTDQQKGDNQDKTTPPIKEEHGSSGSSSPDLWEAPTIPLVSNANTTEPVKESVQQIGSQMNPAQIELNVPMNAADEQDVKTLETGQDCPPKIDNEGLKLTNQPSGEPQGSGQASPADNASPAFSDQQTGEPQNSSHTGAIYEESPGLTDQQTVLPDQVIDKPQGNEPIGPDDKDVIGMGNCESGGSQGKEPAGTVQKESRDLADEKTVEPVDNELSGPVDNGDQALTDKKISESQAENTLSGSDEIGVITEVEVVSTDTDILKGATAEEMDVSETKHETNDPVQTELEITNMETQSRQSNPNDSNGNQNSEKPSNATETDDKNTKLQGGESKHNESDRNKQELKEKEFTQIKERQPDDMLNLSNLHRGGIKRSSGTDLALVANIVEDPSNKDDDKPKTKDDTTDTELQVILISDTESVDDGLGRNEELVNTNVKPAKRKLKEQEGQIKNSKEEEIMKTLTVMEEYSMTDQKPSERTDTFNFGLTHFTVHFHAIMHSSIFDESCRAFVRFASDNLGGWRSNQHELFTIGKDTNNGNIEVEGRVSVPRGFIEKGISYRYFVVCGNDEQQEFVYNRNDNLRWFYVTKKQLKSFNDVFHQYDGVIRGFEAKEGSTVINIIKFVTGYENTHYRKILFEDARQSACTFLPSWQTTSLSPGLTGDDMIMRISLLYRGLRYGYCTNSKALSEQDLKNFFSEAIRSGLDTLWTEFISKRDFSEENRMKIFMNAVTVAYLFKEYAFPLSSDEKSALSVALLPEKEMSGQSNCIENMKEENSIGFDKCCGQQYVIQLALLYAIDTFLVNQCYPGEKPNEDTQHDYGRPHWWGIADKDHYWFHLKRFQGKDCGEALIECLTVVKRKFCEENNENSVDYLTCAWRSFMIAADVFKVYERPQNKLTDNVMILALDAFLMSLHVYCTVNDSLQESADKPASFGSYDTTFKGVQYDNNVHASFLSEKCVDLMKEFQTSIKCVGKGLFDRSITMGHLQIIEEKQEHFFNIVKDIPEMDTKGLKRRIELRTADMNAFHECMKNLSRFIDICHRSEVNTFDIEEQMKKLHNFQDRPLKEICAEVDVPKDVRKYKPRIIAFEINAEILEALPEIIRCSNGNLFIKMWDKCAVDVRKRFDHALGIDEIMEHVWKPACKEWKALHQRLKTGEIFFREFDCLCGRMDPEALRKISHS